MSYALFFDDQIQAQNRNIHSIWLQIARLIGIGLAVSGLSYLIKAAKAALPDVIKMGPTLVGASISMFTGKDISTGCERQIKPLRPFHELAGTKRYSNGIASDRAVTGPHAQKGHGRRSIFCWFLSLACMLRSWFHWLPHFCCFNGNCLPHSEVFS